MAKSIKRTIQNGLANILGFSGMCAVGLVLITADNSVFLALVLSPELSFLWSSALIISLAICAVSFIALLLVGIPEPEPRADDIHIITQVPADRLSFDFSPVSGPSPSPTVTVPMGPQDTLPPSYEDATVGVDATTEGTVTILTPSAPPAPATAPPAYTADEPTAIVQPEGNSGFVLVNDNDDAVRKKCYGMNPAYLEEQQERQRAARIDTIHTETARHLAMIDRDIKEGFFRPRINHSYK